MASFRFCEQAESSSNPAFLGRSRPSLVKQAVVFGWKFGQLCKSILKEARNTMLQLFSGTSQAPADLCTICFGDLWRVASDSTWLQAALRPQGLEWPDLSRTAPAADIMGTVMTQNPGERVRSNWNLDRCVLWKSPGALSRADSRQACSLGTRQLTAPIRAN